LRNLIPDLEAFNILSNIIWDRIVLANSQGDQATVISHFKAFLAGGLISEGTMGNITPVLTTTVSDPNWQAIMSISPAALAGYDTVLTDEVEEALQN
jgi:hypothetical protein